MIPSTCGKPDAALQPTQTPLVYSVVSWRMLLKMEMSCNVALLAVVDNSISHLRKLCRLLLLMTTLVAECRDPGFPGEMRIGFSIRVNSLPVIVRLAAPNV